MIVKISPWKRVVDVATNLFLLALIGLPVWALWALIRDILA